jgi:putative hemolysin
MEFTFRRKNMRRKNVAVLFITLLVILVAVSCSSSVEPEQLANPASEHCVEQGGKLDIRKDADGGEVGYCQFEDGSECDQWAFFRDDCRQGEFSSSTQLANPAAVYCIEQGGVHEIREHDDGGQYGVCIFDDGSECDAWAYFRGECAPGDE